jgi:hypothetical protein
MIYSCFRSSQKRFERNYTQPNYAQPLLRAFDSFFAQMLQSKLTPR